MQNKKINADNIDFIFSFFYGISTKIISKNKNLLQKK